MSYRQPQPTPQEPSVADKLAGSPKEGPKNTERGPWRSPDGTTFPLGKPKGKGKRIKFYLPLWEFSDVERGMQKSGFTTMAPYFRDCERRMRHIGKIQRAAAIRIKDEMAAYALTPRDIEELTK
jgi:hypothetical protein